MVSDNTQYVNSIIFYGLHSLDPFRHFFISNKKDMFYMNSSTLHNMTNISPCNIIDLMH